MNKRKYHPLFGHLPKYVSAFKDSNGKVRLRYRRGSNSYYFKQPFGSAEFDAEMTVCMAISENYSAADFKTKTSENIAPPAITEAPKLGNVYFIGNESSGPIKIGFSTNLAARLGQIRMSSPIPLVVLAQCHGPRSLEMKYHSFFSGYRRHGEWFERHPDILAEINRLNDSQPQRQFNRTPPQEKRATS